MRGTRVACHSPRLLDMRSRRVLRLTVRPRARALPSDGQSRHAREDAGRHRLRPSLGFRDDVGERPSNCCLPAPRDDVRPDSPGAREIGAELARADELRAVGTLGERELLDRVRPGRDDDGATCVDDSPSTSATHSPARRPTPRRTVTLRSSGHGSMTLSSRSWMTSFRPLEHGSDVERARRSLPRSGSPARLGEHLCGAQQRLRGHAAVVRALAVEVGDVVHDVVEGEVLATALVREGAVTLVERDPVDPRGEPSVAAEARERAPGVDEALSGDVLGRARISEQTYEQTVDGRAPRGGRAPRRRPRPRCARG